MFFIVAHDNNSDDVLFFNINRTINDIVWIQTSDPKYVRTPDKDVAVDIFNQLVSNCSWCYVGFPFIKYEIHVIELVNGKNYSRMSLGTK